MLTGDADAKTRPGGRVSETVPLRLKLPVLVIVMLNSTKPPWDGWRAVWSSLSADAFTTTPERRIVYIPGRLTPDSENVFAAVSGVVFRVAFQVPL